MVYFRLTFSKTVSCLLRFTKHKRTAYRSICQISLGLLGCSYILCHVFWKRGKPLSQICKESRWIMFPKALLTMAWGAEASGPSLEQTHKIWNIFSETFWNTSDTNTLFFLLKLVKMNYISCGSSMCKSIVSLEEIWSRILFKSDLDPAASDFVWRKPRQVTLYTHCSLSVLLHWNKILWIHMQSYCLELQCVE